MSGRKAGAGTGDWPVWKLVVAAIMVMTVAVPLLLGLFFAYALLSLFLVIGLFGALAAFRQARLFADTPKSTIRAAAQGHVELVARGKSVEADGRPILGPLSGQACCYWTLEAQHRVRTGKSSSWRTEGEARSTRWLPLSDGTGTCLVAIHDAALHAHERTTRDADAALRRSLAGHFPPAMRKRLNRAGRWRLREVRLPADTDLYAMGLFESRRSSATPDAAYPATDGPDAIAAWQAIMRRIEGIAPAAPLTGIALAHLLLPDRRDGHKLPLIVADRPQHWLVRRYRLYTLGCVLIAVAAAGALLLLLTSQHPELFATLLLWLDLQRF